VRGAGLPLRQASQALLPHQGRHHQDQHEQLQSSGAELSAKLGQNNRQLLVLVILLSQHTGNLMLC